MTRDEFRWKFNEKVLKTKNEKTKAWFGGFGQDNYVVLLPDAQSLELLPEASSLLHLVTRLPTHYTNRFAYQSNVSIQVILRVIKNELNVLWLEVSFLCLDKRHHFLCNFRFWGRLINWNDFRGDKYLYWKKKERAKFERYDKNNSAQLDCNKSAFEAWIDFCSEQAWTRQCKSSRKCERANSHFHQIKGTKSVGLWIQSNLHVLSPHVSDRLSKTPKFSQSKIYS